MVRRAETSQLDLFAVLNLLGIRVTPFNGDLAISIRIYEHVECAVAVELWEESNGCSDLAENGSDFGLDFGFCLFGCGRGGASSSRVFLVFGC